MTTQNYGTPRFIVDAIERDSMRQPFALDVCAEPWSAKAPRFYALPQNGLTEPWVDGSWCNPPYEDQETWLGRAAYWATQGVRSACLVLASTSALYWRRLVWERATCDLYEGRVAFLDPETQMPKPGFDRASALVLYGPGFMPGLMRVRDASTGMLISQLPHRVGDLFEVAA